MSLGIAFNMTEWQKEKNQSKKIVEKVKSLWSMPRFTEHIGIGVSSSSRMVNTIPVGREVFKP